MRGWWDLWARRGAWREGTSRERKNEDEAEAGRNQRSGDGGLIAAIEMEIEITRGGVASAMTREDHIRGASESDLASAITDIVIPGLEATIGVGLLTIWNILDGHCESGAILHNPPAAARGPEIESPHNVSATRKGPQMDIPRSHPAARGPEMESPHNDSAS